MPEMLPSVAVIPVILALVTALVFVVKDDLKVRERERAEQKARLDLIDKYRNLSEGSKDEPK